MDLRSNDIGDEGAYHLADALRDNMVTLSIVKSDTYYFYGFSQTLTTLRLRGNKIGPLGEKHLKDALQNRTVILDFL